MSGDGFPAATSQPVITQEKKSRIFNALNTASTISLPLLVQMAILMSLSAAFSRNRRTPGFSGTSVLYFSIDMAVQSALICSRESGRENRSLK